MADISEPKKSHQELLKAHQDLWGSQEKLRKSEENLWKLFNEIEAFVCERRSFALNEWCGIEPSTTQWNAWNASIYDGDIVQDVTTITNMVKVSFPYSVKNAFVYS